jgi:PhoP regulatory network protein YrbL.
MKLDDTDLLASGGRRDVYRHPDDDRLLVKVFRPRHLETVRRERLRWYRPFRRLRQWTATIRELTEVLKLDAGGVSHPRQIQRFVGLVETDRGLGELVVRKGHGDAFLAPTLHDLVQEGRVDDTVRAAFEDFATWLLESPLVVSDFNPKNFVYARDGDEAPYFAIVDGLGETTYLPVKSLFPALNRRKKREKLDALRRRLDGAGTGRAPDGARTPAGAGIISDFPAAVAPAH